MLALKHFYVHLATTVSRLYRNIVPNPNKMMRPMRVTAIPDDSIITLSLQVGTKNKIFNRPIDETLEKTINRIIATIGEKKKKKIPKRDGAADVNDVPAPNIVLLDSNNTEISFSQNGIDAWKDASTFMIDEQKYKVLFNPPMVTQISLSNSPLVGMTIHPVLQFSHSSLGCSRFKWYRSMESCSVNDTNFNQEQNCESRLWSEVSCEQTYTPSPDDVGHTLKLEVMPGNEEYPVSQSHHGIDSTSTTSGVIHNGPDVCIFDSRHKFTEDFLQEKDSFRVVCYNILADCYATTDLAVSSFFPYCPQHAMNIEYRLQLLLKEIKGYHGDIVCLQEVDRFVFQNYLAPVMSMHNYASAFGNKRNTKEGVALFYNRSKFKLFSVENIVLCEAIKTKESLQWLAELAFNNLSLKQRLLNLGTCMLLAVLQSTDDPSNYLVLVNTHLYFHPRANNLRLIQMAAILSIVEEKLKELESTIESGSRISYIICGDLNSKPTTGAIEYAQSGELPHSHTDWYSGGSSEHHGSKVSLSHHLNLVNACGSPRYTNYAAGFYECLDYILINPHQFKVDQVVDPPPHDLVVRHTALPSIIAPSDHLAQIADLSWLPQEDVEMQS